MSKLDKLNELVNLIVALVVGLFAGHSVYILQDHSKYPDLYAMRSEPWYMSIAVYAVITVVVIAVAIIIKVVAHKKMKNS